MSTSFFQDGFPPLKGLVVVDAPWSAIEPHVEVGRPHAPLVSVAEHAGQTLITWRCLDSDAAERLSGKLGRRTAYLSYAKMTETYGYALFDAGEEIEEYESGVWEGEDDDDREFDATGQLVDSSQDECAEDCAGELRPDPHPDWMLAVRDRFSYYRYNGPVVEAAALAPLADFVAGRLEAFGIRLPAAFPDAARELQLTVC